MAPEVTYVVLMFPVKKFLNMNARLISIAFQIIMLANCRATVDHLVKKTKAIFFFLQLSFVM